MMMRHASIVLALTLFGSSSSFAAEICGNGIDDDGNGLTDEGCYPTLTSGVCESPLSCDDTGDVSWSTGSLHYTLPPDVTTNVPYGPGIGFRRIYTNMYTPGINPTSVNKTPLGPGWQHNYLTFINQVSSTTATWHRVDGRDVLFTKTSTVGSYDYYTPQAGDHVLSFSVLNGASPTYFIQLLTGETLKYNSFGQLIEIWDTLATPNKVLVTWDSTTNGNVSTVTDASGKHRLFFTYTSGHLVSTQLQHVAGAGWTTDHTTSYSYSYSVSQDATSGWYVPANATEWANLLEGTGIPVPTTVWPCQEVFPYSLYPVVGTMVLALTGSGGTATGHTTVSGWSRYALSLTDASTLNWRSTSSLCNPATTKCSMFALVAAAANGVVASTRDVMGMGDSNGSIAEIVNGGIHGTILTPREIWNGSSSANAPTVNTAVHPWILSAEPTSSATHLFTDGGTATPTWSTGTSANGNVTIGSLRTTTEPTSYLYAAQWTGTALTATQAATLIDRIQHGPTSLLASVTIGGTLAQQYTYGAAGNLLTSINDATSQLVSFSYSSTTPGRVNQVSTPKGTLGYEFGSFRTGCSAGGQTLLYFNQGNATSCSTDTDCGTGYMCGGQTGPGATGSCFKAARCLTLANVSGETVVTSVSPVGPGGGTCSGACAETLAHIWSPVTGFINQVGFEDSMFGTTSIALCTTTASRCSASFPYQIGYGDNDSDPTNGGSNRTEWIYYDSTYPGRISEIRRPSNVALNPTSCTYTSAMSCDQTIYSYGANNQLYSVTHSGYTLDNTGTPNSSPTTTVQTFLYDSVGRVTDVTLTMALGAYSKQHLDYYAATDPYPNLLKDEVDYTDVSHTLTTQYLVYDTGSWLPSTIKKADGSFECQSYNPAFHYLSSSRIPMAGQTDCTTPNAADLTTSWVLDSWLAGNRHIALHTVLGVTKQLTRPDGSCVITTVDSHHRVSQVLRRDDCNSSSSGDYEQYLYTADSQVSEVDTYDTSGTIKNRQLYNYYAGRQLQQIVNPADQSTYELFTYDAAGRLSEVDGEANLTKSVLLYNGVPGRDNRVTGLQLNKDTSASDEWDFLYSWAGNQIQATDGDSKVTGTVYDDFGHIVKITTPDLAGPTLGLYDPAGNLTTAVEDLGGGASQLTHTYTYDLLSRPLVTDDPGACATTGTAHAEIQRSYDALPSGVTCPMTGGCNHLQGHLAYVQTILLCSPTYSTTDGSLDQFTYYSYDAAGRLVEEYIHDDSGRNADQLYTYNKDGALASVTTPSGASIAWAYGSSSSNSDTDRVTSVSRSGTAVVDTATWFPFGPLQSYNQKNTLSATAVQTTISRDLAYRVTDVNQKAGATTLFDTTLGIDAHGRVTSRAYTNGASGAQNSYFLYDEQDRVTCETSVIQSTCPSSGTNIKNAHSLSPPFTNAGDWKRVLRPVAGSGGGLINDFNTSGTTYGSSHRITDVNQSDGTTVFGHTAFAYDNRGSRSSDDNTSYLTHDDRTYTYDGRRNLSNVRGQYYTGSAWHYYDVASAFDGLNRRVFKSFYDETLLKTSTWFFYYDPTNRLTEVVYNPDTSAVTTYSVIQLIWLGDRLVAYWQTDYPSVTTSKRYVGTDETGRPIDMWNWPASGNTTRVWAINPDAWGNDRNVTGNAVFQPILFAGQYQDAETAAYENDGATVHRAGLALNGVRTYDPFSASYLQVDPLLDESLSSYGYASTNPVMNIDPDGLMASQMFSGSGCMYRCGDSDDLLSCFTNCEITVDIGLFFSGGGGHATGGVSSCYDASCQTPTSHAMAQDWDTTGFNDPGSAWYGVTCYQDLAPCYPGMGGWPVANQAPPPPPPAPPAPSAPDPFPPASPFEQCMGHCKYVDCSRVSDLGPPITPSQANHWAHSLAELACDLDCPRKCK